MKRVAEVKITIENCNNISKGVISLEEEKLNIRYGMNGTGKSTLSTAISLFSQGKPMDDLKPFGSDDEIIPAISIDGDIQGVRVFNEDFVNNMVFKESTVIDNAFDVFIRTTDYEQKRQNLDNRLLRLKVDIDEKQAWEVMFEEVKNDNFGLEWEPTHQMVQLIDPVTELRKWCKKIVHIHGKDATIDWDAVRHSGISGAVPFVWHRMPGFGDTNWRDIISILRSNGYEDDICIEGYHDPVYSGELEMTGQLHALNYLKWCRGGDFTPTPWAK